MTGFIEYKPYMTRSEFAAHVGVAKSYVTKLGQLDKLVFGEGEHEKLIDVSATKQKMADASGAPERSAVTSSLFAEAKDKREQYLAEMARLDYEERMGKLMLVEDVVAAVSDAATRLRNQLEELPSTLACELAAEPDEDKIKARLASEIEALLLDFSHSMSTLKKQNKD